MGIKDVLNIDHKFVHQWCNKYDEIFSGSYDQIEETAIRNWLSKQGKPKHLNKGYFVRLGRLRIEAFR